MCCDPFCRSCYVKVHSHGKRRYHTYKVDSFNAVVLQERREVCLILLHFAFYNSFFFFFLMIYFDLTLLFSSPP